MFDLLWRLLKYYYLDSAKFFIRLWKNTLALLEEDLAVTLMLRLLLVPLFHDSSFIGRILSIIFRLTRVVIGLFAYVLATFLIIIIALVWYLAPISHLLTGTIYSTIALIIFALIVFALGVLNKPPLRVQDIKDKKYIIYASRIPYSHLTVNNLVASPEVLMFCQSLEIIPTIVEPSDQPIDEQTLIKAYELSLECNAVYLTEIYFFAAYLIRSADFQTKLLSSTLKESDILRALKYIELIKHYRESVFLWDEDFKIRHLKGVNRGWLSTPTPSLDSVSIDLTRDSSGDIPEFVGRKEAVRSILNALASEKGKNVLIVAPAGSGKTLLVKYLAKLITLGDAPPEIATKRLVQIDFTALIAGIQNQGDLALRIRHVFDDALLSGNIIIFVDEIQNFGLGETGNNLNLFALIMPYLESHQLQFISTTDQGSLEKVIERYSSLDRLFTKIELPQATDEEIIEFLIDQTALLQAKYNIRATLPAIDAIAHLSSKFIHNTAQPDSALTLYHDALEMLKSSPKLVINQEVIKSLLNKKIDLPLVDINEQAKSELLNLEDKIHERLIDQEEAVTAVANTLRRAAVAINEQAKPLGSFLFVGPSGVGKTELAKTLSDVYYQGKGTFIRLDMSEYQTPESIGRLIGTENHPGDLTEDVQHHPFSLILLDEFEKADPKVQTLFLQVLEDGRLTDYSSETVDFTNTIIIASSNVASLTIANALKNGQTIESIKPAVQQELLSTFKPELLNRFDCVVIFKPLSSEDLYKIVNIKLQKLKSHLHDQGYLIEFAPDLIAELAKRSFDPVLGARPLRRLIQDTIEARISTMILEGRIQRAERFIADISLLNPPS